MDGQVVAVKYSKLAHTIPTAVASSPTPRASRVCSSCTGNLSSRALGVFMPVLLLFSDILKDGTPTCIPWRSMVQRKVESGLYYTYI